MDKLRRAISWVWKILTSVFGSSQNGRRPDDGEEICFKNKNGGRFVLKVVGGGLLGVLAVLIAGLLIGLTPIGPIAGGLFASLMGAGLVAGSWMAIT